MSEGESAETKYFKSVGRAAQTLGTQGGNPLTLGNEFGNVMRAVDAEIITFEEGAKAMDIIARQAEGVKAQGGKP